MYKKLIATILICLQAISCTVLETAQEVLNDNTLLAGVAGYEAMKYIIELSDNPQGRAERVLDYTDNVVRFLDDEAGVTVNGLYDYVHGLVMAQVPPIDRQPVEDLLNEFKDRLAQELGEYHMLTPETEVSVLHVISRMRMAAEFYVNG